MATEVLEACAHGTPMARTYMQDAESLAWVFVYAIYANALGADDHTLAENERHELEEEFRANFPGFSFYSISRRSVAALNLAHRVRDTASDVFTSIDPLTNVKGTATLLRYVRKRLKREPYPQGCVDRAIKYTCLFLDIRAQVAFSQTQRQSLRELVDSAEHSQDLMDKMLAEMDKELLSKEFIELEQMEIVRAYKAWMISLYGSAHYARGKGKDELKASIEALGLVREFVAPVLYVSIIQ